MFSRGATSPSVSQRVSTIEAWLSEQPDPFLDHPIGHGEPQVPLEKKRRRRSNNRTVKKLADPDPIQEAVQREDQRPDREPPKQERRKEKKVRTSRDSAASDSPQTTSAVRQVDHATCISPKSSEGGQISKDDSPVRLRRRGARSSRARTESVSVDLPICEDKSTPERRPLPSSLSEDRPHPTTSRRRQPVARARPAAADAPTASKRLSTIASVETLQADQGNHVAPPVTDGQGLRRRLTTHEDLMSVLSLPHVPGSVKSARSVRTNKTRMSAASLSEIFQDLDTEEARYMRELKTLVDGVIPVLLQCVLSKSDSAAAAGLFSASATARDDLNFTKPIIDMGVALERLKTLHRRIPTQDLASLLIWAQSAHKVYVDYLKAWRLGFQDVVVNLAPSDDQKWDHTDQGMARDHAGDVINSRGEKVDVAYLLKRPLVRIKNLAKVFSRLKVIKPSPKAAAIADQYEDLIKKARQRSNEEQSRLEDEAAANIDATKARDLQSLAVLSDVTVNKSRRVRARDCFSLTVHHSSGQRLDCQIELLLRDDPAADGGDLLVCEVEDPGRWLLFPPLETGQLSARYGNNEGELVVMIRHTTVGDNDPYELLLLRTNDINAASEWAGMLGSNPFPPEFHEASTFAGRLCAPPVSLPPSPTNVDDRIPPMSRSASLREIEIPLGEPSIMCEKQNRPKPRTSTTVRRRERPANFLPNTTIQKDVPSKTQVVEEAGPLQPVSTPSPRHKRDPSLDPLLPASPTTIRRAKVVTSRPARHRQSASNDLPVTSSLASPEKLAEATPTLRKSRTASVSRESLSPSESHRPFSSGPDTRRDSGADSKGLDSTIQRPDYRRAKSSTPSKELPIIPRQRPSSAASASPLEAIREPLIRDEETSSWEKFSSNIQPAPGRPTGQAAQPWTAPTPIADEVVVWSKSEPDSPRSSSPAEKETQPVPPPHRTPLRKDPFAMAPVFKAQSQPSPRSAPRGNRRSSSPLKYQYEPSSTSESDESSDSEESIASSISETEEERAIGRRDEPPTIPPVRAANLKETTKLASPASLPDLPSGTLAPSNSASQAPYRTVPRLTRQSTSALVKKIATVCAWSDKGVWESLHSEECSIVVSPGLIEAYEMSAAHSGPQAIHEDGTITDGSSYDDNEDVGVRPIVGFELTPLVPLRRGTALDISIRSPPTRESKIKTNTNIMFRSRNAQECEELYAMINFARINNPTWIALEKARPKEVSAMAFDPGRGSARHSRAGSKYGTWFGFGSLGRKPSYRASSTPGSGSASIAGGSDSSIGSMSSALSALRRFSGTSNDGKMRFNLNRSSVLRKHGRFGTGGSNSLYSSSSGTTRTGGSASGAASPALSQLCLAQPIDEPVASSASVAPPGTVNNIKVRLYTRESAARWRNLGSGRLCVLPAPVVAAKANADETYASGGVTDLDASSVDPAASGGSPRPPSTTFVVGQPGQGRGPRLSSSNHTPHRVHGNGNEKRILIMGKSKGNTLLDATLHESCFERIARTGIAISVWEERAEVAKIGGVVGGKATTYMMQMRGEAEASWVFGLVGRLRY